MSAPYLDASAIAPLFIAEDRSGAIEAFLAAHDDASLLVSDFAMGEFSSLCARHVRMGSLSPFAASEILQDGDAWSSQTNGVQISSMDVANATRLVRRFELGLRLPDAIHLVTCQRLRATLVTFDKKMVAAAGGVGLAVISPE